MNPIRHALALALLLGCAPTGGGEGETGTGNGQRGCTVLEDCFNGQVCNAAGFCEAAPSSSSGASDSGSSATATSSGSGSPTSSTQSASGSPTSAGTSQGASSTGGVSASSSSGSQSSSAPAMLVGDPVMFSEYVEGSAQNKAIELWNRSWMAVDLGAYNLEMQVPNSAAQRYLPMGMLGPNEVRVICGPQVDATLAARCDDTWSSLQFNGDETLVLSRGFMTVDVFGDGLDPGSAWGTTVRSENMTLRRKCGVSPLSTMPAMFDPADQWTAHPLNDFSGLGMPECMPYVAPSSSSSSSTGGGAVSSGSSSSGAPGMPGTPVWSLNLLEDKYLHSLVAADHGLIMVLHVYADGGNDWTRLISRDGALADVRNGEGGTLQHSPAGILKYVSTGLEQGDTEVNAWVDRVVAPLSFTMRQTYALQDVPAGTHGTLVLSPDADEFVHVTVTHVGRYNLQGEELYRIEYQPSFQHTYGAIAVATDGTIAVACGENSPGAVCLFKPPYGDLVKQFTPRLVVGMQFVGSSLLVLIQDVVGGTQRALIQTRSMENALVAAVESVDFLPWAMALLPGGDTVLAGTTRGVLQATRPLVRRISMTTGETVWEYRPPEVTGILEAFQVAVAPNGDLYAVLGSSRSYGPLLGRPSTVVRLVP